MKHLILALEDGVDPRCTDLTVLAERGAWTVFEYHHRRVGEAVGLGALANVGVEDASALGGARTYLELMEPADEIGQVGAGSTEDVPEDSDDPESGG